MRNDQQLPISLKIIAAVYILHGLWDFVAPFLVETAKANDVVGIIVNTVHIFAGFGLLQLSPGWRKFCLCICWIVFIVGILVVIVVIATLPSVFSDADAPSVIDWLGGTAVLGFYVWQYLTLTSPSIRRLFCD